MDSQSHPASMRSPSSWSSVHHCIRDTRERVATPGQQVRMCIIVTRAVREKATLWGGVTTVLVPLAGVRRRASRLSLAARCRRKLSPRPPSLGYAKFDCVPHVFTPPPKTQRHPERRLRYQSTYDLHHAWEHRACRRLIRPSLCRWSAPWGAGLEFVRLGSAHLHIGVWRRKGEMASSRVVFIPLVQAPRDEESQSAGGGSITYPTDYTTAVSSKKPDFCRVQVDN